MVASSERREMAVFTCTLIWKRAGCPIDRDRCDCARGWAASEPEQPRRCPAGEAQRTEPGGAGMRREGNSIAFHNDVVSAFRRTWEVRLKTRHYDPHENRFGAARQARPSTALDEQGTQKVTLLTSETVAIAQPGNTGYRTDVVAGPVTVQLNMPEVFALFARLAARGTRSRSTRCRLICDHDTLPARRDCASR